MKCERRKYAVITVGLINKAISVLFVVCYFYQVVYTLIAVLRKKSRVSSFRLHSYAVLIAARNEREVIAELIKSLKAQRYPSERIKIFVVADNCTDDTAVVAEKAGAVVYQRRDTIHVGKGYALDYLLGCIEADYPAGSFDGYFVFDADNLLEEDYIYEMNKLFSQGYRVITGCRCSKNYGDNWISSGYGLYFLRDTQLLNKARHLLGLCCHISGTGFMFSDEILRKNGGWKYFSLSEDTEFTAKMIIAGERVGYCESAVLYDEQPTSLGQSIRQRLRWAKGHIQVMSSCGGGLARGTLMPGSARKRLSCLDMLLSITPAYVLTVAAVVVNLAGLLVSLTESSALLFTVSGLISCAVGSYLSFFAVGLVTTLCEWNKLGCGALKKLMYAFSFPLFMATYVPISVAALFVRVEWKPIVHRRSVSLSQLREAQK